ncbi:MAG: histone deacetylase family protein [Gemmatimonadetes bacterium]|nr:histone deacetylase family protein [Gemmatimonadota bacterium]
MLRDRVIEEGIVSPGRVMVPPAARDDELLLVHEADFVARYGSGRLTPQEERVIGLPWSPELVERSRRAAGGTIAAARHALAFGVAMNLAGGTHHAFADHGEGFCVFNDVAVSIRVLQRDGLIRRAAVVDLDVHQGNGTHSIFANDDSVFTFSMHGGKNFPFHKVAGTLDVELSDRMGDEEYLTLLTAALPGVLAAAAPDLVFYIAGADPHEGDALGRLSLTFEGLARRDAFVISQCREVGLPIVITIGGGYGKRIEDTVKIHAETARIAASFT